LYDVQGWLTIRFDRVSVSHELDFTVLSIYILKNTVLSILRFICY